MNTSGIIVRKSAIALLNAVLGRCLLLSDAICASNDHHGNALSVLSPPDRARSQRLVTITLRHLEKIDTLLAKFLKTLPPLSVRNVLRLCTTEILLDNVAKYAAVNDAVNIVKAQPKTRKFAALTNAVCRKIACQNANDFIKKPPQKLPFAIRHRFIKAYGKTITQNIELAHQNGAHTDLTLKCQSQISYYSHKLNAHPLANGSLRLKAQGQISALPGFKKGDWWVQDIAASIAINTLGDCHGKRALDLCAAPGGKTLQLASRGAQVTALDKSPHRIDMLVENLRRVGVRAKIITADALTWQPKAAFDLIIVDAPCSASGTIRRHPDLVHVKKNLNLTPLIALQRSLLNRAVKWLVAGGILIFLTCSLFEEEGELQAEWILQKYDNLTVIPQNPHSLGLPNDSLIAQKYIRTRPDFWSQYRGMDGFFIAKFRKNIMRVNSVG